MLSPGDLNGVEQGLALRLIAVARSIAPGLDSLEGVAKLDAIAVLEGVAAEVPAPGSRRVRSQARNGTSVSMDGFQSAFSADDRAALRALCAAASGLSPASPVGHFPPSGIVSQVWPERS